MEFEELLKYKPSLDLENLTSAENAERAAAEAGKRKRPASDDAGGAKFARAGGPPDEDERARAMRLMMEDTAPVAANDIDLAGLRRLALALERRVSKNQQMRMKYSGEPTKFMDSEIALNSAIKDFGALATAPDLYPEFVRLGSLKTMIGLLHHENTDIGDATIELIQELTDGDAVNDDEDAAKALLDGLFDAQLLSFLFETLKRLEEPKDSDTVHRCLGILENMLELQPILAERIVKEGDILSWLLKRVKGKRFDNNKLYASEILAILVQDTDSNRKAVADIDGIALLLKNLAPYKKRDPTTTEEYEMLENLFDVLVSILMYEPNRERFIEEEGLDLMIILLRERRFSQHGALKVLNHMINRPNSSATCAAFVERLGLKSLFPAFMKTPGSGKSKKHFSEADFEEHATSIVASLLTHLTIGGHETQALRVLRKFVENDFAKLERLVELHLKYYKKVEECEKSIADDIRSIEAREEEIDEIMENDHFLKRLDSGLATLQNIDICIGEVCFQCGAQTKERVAQLLKLKGGDFAVVHRIVDEYRENLSLNEDSEANAKVSERMSKLLLVL